MEGTSLANPNRSVLLGREELLQPHHNETPLVLHVDAGRVQQVAEDVDGSEFVHVRRILHLVEQVVHDPIGESGG